MSQPTCEQPPSQWAAIVSYSKTIVTLAAALLGLTITFSEQILPEESTPWQIWSLRSSWALLLICILSSILAMAFCINYLRNGTKDKRCVLMVNTAFIALALAGVSFFVLGLSGVGSVSISAGEAISIARSTAATANFGGITWHVAEMKWQPSTHEYELIFQDVSGAKRCFIHVGAIDGKVTELLIRRPAS